MMKAIQQHRRCGRVLPQPASTWQNGGFDGVRRDPTRTASRDARARLMRSAWTTTERPRAVASQQTAVLPGHPQVNDRLFSGAWRRRGARAQTTAADRHQCAALSERRFLHLFRGGRRCDGLGHRGPCHEVQEIVERATRSCLSARIGRNPDVLAPLTAAGGLASTWSSTPYRRAGYIRPDQQDNREQARCARLTNTASTCPASTS